MHEDKSSFIKAMGDTPLIRVLDFMLCEGSSFDYPATDIAKNSGVSYITVNKILPRLLELGVIKKTREVGRATMYQLDVENEITKTLMELDKKITLTAVHKQLANPQ